MCGFLVSTNPEHRGLCFDTALRLMQHRGPDVVGNTSSSGRVALGHNRLSILDLDQRANQPFIDSSGRYSLVFNGEIYNFLHLARQHDISMRTTSDSELIVELYARIGPKMLDELNGMFTLVIHDTLDDSLFVARDRLGIKPLYLYRSDSGVLLSSEIAPILSLVGSLPFDEFALRQYRKMRAFFNGRTPYSGIEMFPAAHWWDGTRFHRYWNLPEGEQQIPDGDELRELVTSAVIDRCISDVPVGSYLSGGLDSTIVAGLAEKPDTWTVGFETSNEFDHARTAATAFNSRHTEVLATVEEFVPTCEQMIVDRREPLSVPNEVLLFWMTRQVKTRNTVVLSGEGADELFFGYDRIFRWAATSEWNLEEFSRLYSYGSHQDLEVVEDALAPFLCHERAIDIVGRFFQIAHLHGLLRRLDNSTMRCSVEGRVPFVDHRLVGRMAGVPFQQRMPGGVVKAPLKAVFADLVPESIRNREKIGFPVPLAEVDFPGTSSTLTPMDRWLQYNLQVLTGGGWEDTSSIGGNTRTQEATG